MYLKLCFFSLDTHRLQRDFIADFVSKNNNGMELLLRTLSILQRLLHEASQQPSSKLSTLLNRNASNKRRKAGVSKNFQSFDDDRKNLLFKHITFSSSNTRKLLQSSRF